MNYPSYLSKGLKEIASLFVACENNREVTELLEDLLTPAEIETVIERWEIMKRLASGQSQRTISRELQVGIATITRGSRILNGKQGGFHRALKHFGYL